MIISSFPVSSHVIASRIKKMDSDIKWIAEFPDLWSYNHVYPYNTLRQRLDIFIEKKILKKCDKIITCQPGWAETLKNIHNTQVQYIPHCIDLKLHEEFNKKNRERNQKLHK